MIETEKPVPVPLIRRADRALALSEEGRYRSAALILEKIIEFWPGAFDLLRLLARRAQLAEDTGRAIGYSDLALRIKPEAEHAVLWHAELLIACGRTGAARMVLKSALPRVRDRAPILRRLQRMDPRGQKALAGMLAKARECAAAEGHASACKIVSAALDRFGTDPEILAFLVQHCLIWAPTGLMGYLEVPDGDASVPNLPGNLRRRVLLHFTQYQEALTEIRGAGPGSRRMRDARDIAVCLAGLHRYRLAERYLRFCIRRWPGARAIFQEQFNLYMKLGHHDEAAALLDGLQTERPEFSELIAASQALLLCHCGPVEDMVAHFDREIAPHSGHFHLRKVVQRRLMGEALCARAEDVERQIKFQSKSRVTLHWQGFQIGQMMNELRLTQQMLDGGAGAENAASAENRPVDAGLRLDALRDKVLSNPNSTVLAIRFIARTLTETPERLAFESSGVVQLIPKVISLYWNQHPAPEQVLDYVASWRAAPQHEHRLYSRESARKFMDREMGPLWVRAFNMARHPAEQADLLRLCLLVRHGGIWADADDFLYGDLARLIPQGAGLVLYREPVGGAIANNFMAARPGHPAVTYAANLVRQALLQRSSETIWLKSGPGLLSRAVGQYLAQAEDAAIRSDLVLLDQATVRREISIHNRVYHKAAGGHWNSPNRSDPGYLSLFEAALAARARHPVPTV